MKDSLDLNLTEDEVNLLDSVLTNELIRVEFPNGGEQKKFVTDEEKKRYKVLADLLRKIKDASTFFKI